MGASEKLLGWIVQSADEELRIVLDDGEETCLPVTPILRAALDRVLRRRTLAEEAQEEARAPS